MIDRFRAGARRLAVRGIATGQYVSFPVFDGAEVPVWRDRDLGTAGLAGTRAAMRLGAWAGILDLVVVVGADADAAAVLMAAHPSVRAAPSFDLPALTTLSARALAGLIRLYAQAFRSAGVWNGMRAVAAPEGDATCLVAAWPRDLPEDAAARLAGLARAIAPRRLRLVIAGAGDLPSDLADAFDADARLELAPGALFARPDAAARQLFALARLSPDAASVPADVPVVDPSPHRVHVVSCLSVAHDLPLLTHFLDHYAGLGVRAENIHVILNAREADAPGLDAARRILGERGACAGDIWIGPYSSIEMWTRRRALHVRLVRPGDWAISADADELHVYPAGLAATLRALRDHDADWLQGPMIDRVGAGGALCAVTPSEPIWDQFPVEGDLMCQISRRPELKDGGGTVKAMLMVAHMLPGLGGHGVLRDECAARARQIAAGLGIDLEAPRTPYERSLRRAATMQPAPLLGSNIGGHPRITDADFRLSFPAYVAHFKWRDVLVDELARRRASGLQTAAASQYAAVLQDFLTDPGRLDLGRMVVRSAWHRPDDWAAHVARLRAWAVRRGDPALGPVRTAAQQAHAAEGWRVRQLTFGSAGGVGHFHSYYDIPVLDAAETRIAGVRYDTPERPLEAGDAVGVGTVDLDGGGFTEIARSGAWSWQQGPMLQWLPGAGDRLIWNDRDGDRFVARMADADGGDPARLDRPVYALDPRGGRGLSLDFARLDALRPGYGYAGGAADLSDPAPDGDGVWRVALDGGAAELVLSLARARACLTEILGAEDRAEHAGAGFAYWFNHCKVAPGGERFTVKLRWRRPGGGWNGTMGVSLTCGMDGADPRVVARATSHVIWLDDGTLYYWNQAAGQVVFKRDAPATWPPQDEVFDPAVFASNVHLRHVPDDPRRMVFDTPYAAVVDIRTFDRDTGRAAPVARFGGHEPARGQFRCDLHPVPTRDGARIVVSSLADGMRQIYVAERA